MLTSEFSTQFDIYFNNIMSNQAPGIDEYEKSVYLTDAEKQIILEIYTGKFEVTEQARRSIDSLVKTANLSPESIDSTEFSNTYRINTSTSTFLLPSDVWFITYEAALYDEDSGCAKDKIVEVIPTTQDDLHRILNNPFRGPSLNKVLRLDCGNSEVELVSKYNIGTYKIRYIATPRPIILEKLEGVTIDGESEVTECELHESLHPAILERAVLLAKQSWVNLKAYNNK